MHRITHPRFITFGGPDPQRCLLRTGIERHGHRVPFLDDGIDQQPAGDRFFQHGLAGKRKRRFRTCRHRRKRRLRIGQIGSKITRQIAVVHRKNDPVERLAEQLATRQIIDRKSQQRQLVAKRKTLLRGIVGTDLEIIGADRCRRTVLCLFRVDVPASAE